MHRYYQRIFSLQNFHTSTHCVSILIIFIFFLNLEQFPRVFGIGKINKKKKKKKKKRNEKIGARIIFLKRFVLRFKRYSFIRADIKFPFGKLSRYKAQEQRTLLKIKLRFCSHAFHLTCRDSLHCDKEDSNFHAVNYCFNANSEVACE